MAEELKDVLAEDEVVEHTVEGDEEVIKVIRKGEKKCAEEQVVEIFEDVKILSKRITEYVKPVVYKIKTEHLDACGNVVNVVVQELDEGTMAMAEHHEGPMLAAQSVEVEAPKHEPTVTHVTVPYSEMKALSHEGNRSYHKYNRCHDCGGMKDD